MQIAAFFPPPFFKGQKAGGLEGKHGIGRHETIRNGDFGLTVARLGSLLKTMPHAGDEGIRAQMFAQRRPESLLLGRLVLSLELSPFHGDLTYTTGAGLSRRNCSPGEKICA
jgi:hypothetical protein